MTEPKIKKALVRFMPVESYFFGGESTHGSLGAEAQYFSKSNPCPQQTTLVGTLRNLLRLAGYDFGLQSFAPDGFAEAGFGDLHSISPLFLTDGGGKFFLRQALDRHAGGSAAFQISKNETADWLLFDGDENFKNAARWQGYNPKNDLADEWVSPDGTRLKPDQIFKTFIRPGIPKKELHRRDTVGPGFFKHELIKMADGWSFAVVAEFLENVDFEKLNGATAQIGGEKSIFQISVEAAEEGFEQIFPAEKMFYPTEHQSVLPRLVLVSDADIPDDAWLLTAAAVTETTDFRFFQTFFNGSAGVQIGSIERFSPSGKVPLSAKKPLGKSTKFTLLGRGSVLVCPDDAALDALAEKLAIEPWRSAGFNHFFKYPVHSTTQPIN